MTKQKKMGRPPAPWMHKLLELKLNTNSVTAYEISELLEVNVRTVKSFFQKLPLEPKYELENGFIRARYKTSDVKKAVKAYIAPWL